MQNAPVHLQAGAQGRVEGFCGRPFFAAPKSVAYLAPLANTRKCLEIDWANGRPVFATSRHGVGYVTKLH